MNLLRLVFANCTSWSGWDVGWDAVTEFGPMAKSDSDRALYLY
jgi:hypothetical protein